MDIKFNIPDYLSIQDWKFFQSLEIENENEKMVKFLSRITDIDEGKILELTPFALQSTYSAVLTQLGNPDPTFFPVFELDNQLYGYSSISKMTLGEYIDLQKLTKSASLNLEEIMAILYRPIKKQSFQGITWAIKSKIKVGKGEVENLFKYYTLEKYDSSKRAIQAGKMKDLPVSFALGALAFFLVLTNTSLLSTQVSLLPKTDQEEMMKKVKQTASIPIGDGLAQFITYLKHPSLTLQGGRTLLT